MTYSVLLSETAKHEITQALEWTEENFGAKQRAQYKRIIASALRLLSKSPTKLPCRARADIGDGVYYLHIARARNKAKHFFLYRILPNKHIRILRFMHDAMDLSKNDI